jgi:hypothetical protein
MCHRPLAEVRGTWRWLGAPPPSRGCPDRPIGALGAATTSAERGRSRNGAQVADKRSSCSGSCRCRLPLSSKMARGGCRVSAHLSRDARPSRRGWPRSEGLVPSSLSARYRPILAHPERPGVSLEPGDILIAETPPDGPRQLRRRRPGGSRHRRETPYRPGLGGRGPLRSTARSQRCSCPGS